LLLRQRSSAEGNRNSGTAENTEVGPSFDQTALILGFVKALEDDLNAKVNATRKDLEAHKSETVERDRLLQQLKTEIQTVREEVRYMDKENRCFGLCSYCLSTFLLDMQHTPNFAQCFNSTRVSTV
jgi:septal ring factor EnvC (AmiA/AmiB activator)